MLENEKNMVQKIDKLILDELKKIMEIKKDKVNIISDNEIEEILKIINEKMEEIFLLYGRFISVCLDRKLFMEKVLTQNISLSFLQQYIQIEEIEI